MRIVILSDSLGRARPDIEEMERTLYEDVYGYKLKKNFYSDEVELCYIESLDTEDAVFWSQRMVAFRRPDIVIYHLGINDAVPRIFKKGSRSILKNSLFQKISFNIVLRFISRYRYNFTKFVKKTYVSMEDTKNNFLKMTTEVKQYNSRAIFIGISIAKTSKKIEEISYGINTNITKYNLILKDVFGDNYIEINELLPNKELLISDGIHLTINAHDKLFNKIKEHVDKEAWSFIGKAVSSKIEKFGAS
jgi:lysophospholipase L1-like esterase